MRKHHQKRSKITQTKFKCQLSAIHVSDLDFELVAEELLGISKKRLPNGVMTGILRGQEDDIRQEAVLLSLKWYINWRRENCCSEMTDWNPAQAICAALKYCKLDLIKKCKGEQKARAALAQEIRMHHMDCSPHVDSWSPAEIRMVVEKSIMQALKSGRISQVNASVAIQVYVEGVPVKELAKQLNRTKSSIHQHLTRVRNEIPEIVRTMREDRMM